MFNASVRSICVYIMCVLLHFFNFSWAHLIVFIIHMSEQMKMMK